MQYTDFQKTGFYSWFGIQETGREKYNNKLTRVNLKPGAHQNMIDLHMELTDVDKIDSVTLLVDRSLLISPTGINPLIVDIVKSFIDVMIPDSEQSIRDPLVQAVWDLTDKARTIQIFQHNASTLDPAVINSLSARLPGLSMPMITNAQPNTPVPLLHAEILYILLTCLGIKDLAVLAVSAWSLTASNESIADRLWLKLCFDFQT